MCNGQTLPINQNQALFSLIGTFYGAIPWYVTTVKLDLEAMENCVCFNLRWVSRVVTQFFHAKLRRQGIRPTQTPILQALKRRESWNMADLSDWLGMERTTLLRNLRPLQRDDRAALLDAYAKVRRGERVVDNHLNPVINELRLSGIVRVVDGFLKDRNRIYARVFDLQSSWLRLRRSESPIRAGAAASSVQRLRGAP